MLGLWVRVRVRVMGSGYGFGLWVRVAVKPRIWVVNSDWGLGYRIW